MSGSITEKFPTDRIGIFSLYTAGISESEPNALLSSIGELRSNLVHKRSGNKKSRYLDGILIPVTVLYTVTYLVILQV